MNSASIDIETYQSDTDATQSLLLVRVRPASPSPRPPVLLLHGSTLPGSIAYTLRFDGRSWLDDLALRGLDGWALDVRGYGGSWKPADDGERPCAPVADTAQAAEDVGRAIAFILAETGADHVDLVGWSWGATVAAAYMAGGGAGVRRLVLHAPQWLRDTPSPMVTSKTLTEPYRPVDPGAFVARWLGRVDARTREVLQGWTATLAQALADHAPISVPNGSVRDIATQWMAGRPAYDPADITAPTLVIVGAADTDTPPALGRIVHDLLVSRIKRFATVADGTHFTVFEPARDRLFEDVAAFLAENTEQQD
jgi:pimeloyl-ACP methyl ester carboxylesterase